MSFPITEAIAGLAHAASTPEVAFFIVRKALYAIAGGVVSSKLTKIAIQNGEYDEQPVGIISIGTVFHEKGIGAKVGLGIAALSSTALGTAGALAIAQEGQIGFFPPYFDPADAFFAAAGAIAGKAITEVRNGQ